MTEFYILLNSPKHHQNVANKAKLGLLGFTAERGNTPGQCLSSDCREWEQDTYSPVGSGWGRLFEAGNWLGLDKVSDTVTSQWWTWEVRLLKQVLRGKLVFISELFKGAVLSQTNWSSGSFWSKEQSYWWVYFIFHGQRQSKAWDHVDTGGRFSF